MPGTMTGTGTVVVPPPGTGDGDGEIDTRPDGVAVGLFVGLVVGLFVDDASFEGDREVGPAAVVRLQLRLGPLPRDLPHALDRLGRRELFGAAPGLDVTPRRRHPQPELVDLLGLRYCRAVRYLVQRIGQAPLHVDLESPAARPRRQGGSDPDRHRGARFRLIDPVCNRGRPARVPAADGVGQHLVGGCRRAERPDHRQAAVGLRVYELQPARPADDQ
jgi:hypothetical protein